MDISAPNAKEMCNKIYNRRDGCHIQITCRVHGMKNCMPQFAMAAPRYNQPTAPLFVPRKILRREKSRCMRANSLDLLLRPRRLHFVDLTPTHGSQHTLRDNKILMNNSIYKLCSVLSRHQGPACGLIATEQKNWACEGK